MNELELSRPTENVPRLTLFVLLAANAALQTGGGAMMLLEPRRLAVDTFGIAIGHEAAPFVSVIGGATVSFALVSGTAAWGVLRRRAWAHVPSLLLGSMLLTVGAVMLASGIRIGAFDLAKGIVFVVGGAWCSRRPWAEGPRAPIG